MTAYKPRARKTPAGFDDLEQYGLLPDLHVFEREDGIPTGILDKDGQELFRYDRGPMGFVK